MIPVVIAGIVIAAIYVFAFALCKAAAKGDRDLGMK